MKVFNVYLNGEYVGQTSAPTKIEAKSWIGNNVIITHMGEWKKTFDGYDYHTTTGRTYSFVKRTNPKENGQ
jgi:hypothetical protein